jgi:hypothetical protein
MFTHVLLEPIHSEEQNVNKVYLNNYQACLHEATCLYSYISFVPYRNTCDTCCCGICFYCHFDDSVIETDVATAKVNSTLVVYLI